ncbi:B3 domain-containing transcription repressor VAL2 isoform X2 [Hevea brasiliensis]|uniref:B3 domain-containing transcription repressor VAL2 isoform X2 n=1 Tax=Hevea brasiliensis TaxID=3981 RepID=UPI0025CC2186|nr:B3 domain-containing transcription repressor VAL2 isoform X2 [Hevea brasiliensis]
MGSKVCMNASCGTTTTREWKRGWRLRSGGYACLCYTCGYFVNWIWIAVMCYNMVLSTYDDSVYCDTFHLEESGWRECKICSKRLHCGCIASTYLLEILDFGGVGCTSCAKISQLHSVRSIHSNEISNAFGSVTTNNAVGLESTPPENRVAGSALDEGKLAQLCRIMEANKPTLLCQSEGADTNASPGHFRQEEVIHPIGEAGTGFSNESQLSVGISRFAKPDSIRPILEMRDMNGSLVPSLTMTLGAPSGTTSFGPYPCGAVEGRGKSITPPFQQGQRSRPILPKLPKPGSAGSSETNNAVVPELRIARTPAEGRGKNQLLPRYWPRITDLELQQLSGDLNSNIVPLFEKVLSASDAGRIGRLVLPKACAEAYFPPISQSEGVPLRIQDFKGREWTFQFRFWPNNNSRMYVLEGVTPCIQSMQLQAGDTITFSRIDPGGKLVMGFRKATNNSDTQEAQTTALPSGTASAETSFSADGDIGWNKGESQGGKINGDARHQPTAEKKRNRNIGPKSKRLLMHREDALELRLTWEEAQDLLRPPPSVKPSIVTIEDHEFEEFDEPPVFGKRTIFAHQSSGGQEQWAQCDDCSKWRKLPEHVLLPPKWTCSDNIWDSSRCLCSAPEEISPKDLDNLLRLSKDFKKRRIVGRHKPSPECEPSGLDALASAAVLGDNIGDTGEPSVGATTKHPRHRSGCTCIVCIQPPSGKGKHNPTCTCNVCMTVKRRFKTLMLRKKKRQSEEHEAEISQKDNNDHKDESEMISKLSNAVLPVSNSGNEVSQNRKQTEVAETSAGSLDLNCHPNRDEMQLDMPGLSMMNIGDPFDSYTKQNGLPNLMCDRHSSFGPCLHSQTNGEYPRTLSDEAFHDSMGWNRESRGD